MSRTGPATGPQHVHCNARDTVIGTRPLAAGEQFNTSRRQIADRLTPAHTPYYPPEQFSASRICRSRSNPAERAEMLVITVLVLGGCSTLGPFVVISGTNVRFLLGDGTEILCATYGLFPPK